MGKKFVIIRHAKAKDTGIGMRDFERPLHPKGMADAEKMGKLLLSEGWLPDIILTSTALRTQQTATIIEEIMRKNGLIQSEDKLYNSPESIIEECIRSLSEDYKTAFIVAHNPGVSYFASDYSGNNSSLNMAPCTTVILESTAETWELIDRYNTKLIKIYTP